MEIIVEDNISDKSIFYHTRQINVLAAVGCLVGMQMIFSGRLKCPLLSISNIRGGGCMQTAENQFDALDRGKNLTQKMISK